MRRRRIAFACWLGTTLGIIATGCGSSSVLLPPEPITCSLTGDTDSMTHTFTLTHLSMPPGTASRVGGFDFDGLDNSKGGDGATIEGCGVTDARGGVDNSIAAAGAQLSELASGAAQSVDDVLQGFLDNEDSPLVIELRVHHWNGTQDDPCLGLDLAVGVEGDVAVRASGTGVLVGGRTTIAGPTVVPISFGVEALPSGSSPGGTGNLDINFYGARIFMSIEGEGAAATLAPGSYFGGYVYYKTVPGEESPYAGLSTFRNELQELLGPTELNYPTGTVNVALAIFDQFVDLRMTPEGGLEPCAGPSLSAVDSNAISVALAIDSQP